MYCSPANTGPAKPRSSLGLADAIGDLRSTLRARYGDKVLMPVIAPASGMLSGLLGRRSPGAGTLAALDGSAGLPDEFDFRAGDPPICQIRVLRGGRPRHLAR